MAREASEAKQAVNPVVLDISKLSNLTHYFVIAQGNSDPHVRAIAQHVQEELEKAHVPLGHCEGMREGKWVLMDFGSAIVHVFYRDLRQFYGLERLWGNAPQV